MNNAACGIRNILALFLCVVNTSIAAACLDLQDSVNALNVRGFEDKMAAAQALAQRDDTRIDTILEAFIEGKLYVQRSDKRVVFADKSNGGGYILT
ncbi:MAG: hypothetical protein P8L31_12885, partial [Pseudomonadales bacterium]|nr:hypothetical protein [Pseudomonadales bacterium]